MQLKPKHLCTLFFFDEWWYFVVCIIIDLGVACGHTIFFFWCHFVSIYVHVLWINQKLCSWTNCGHINLFVSFCFTLFSSTMASILAAIFLSIELGCIIFKAQFSSKFLLSSTYFIWKIKDGGDKFWVKSVHNKHIVE